MTPDRDSLSDLSERHWYCAPCGTFDGPIAGEAYCDVCADGTTVRQYVPADCEWSEMVAYHQERYSRLRAENERLREIRVAMRVSSKPERFVWGDADTLAWLRDVLSVAIDEEGR